MPYDKALKVNTAWDLGISDSTAIWFYQAVGREIRMIDYYEAAGHGLDHYAGVLDKRGYLYGKHYAPHDIQVRELGSGKSRLETARGLGIKFEVLPADSVQDGISTARLLISRMYFDESKCAVGIDALRQYREKRDEKSWSNSMTTWWNGSTKSPLSKAPIAPNSSAAAQRPSSKRRN